MTAPPPPSPTMPPRRPVGRRLLTVLQLTRAALVYTAVSNGLASLALRARWEVGPGGDLLDFITAPLALATVAVAAGLYGFGMSLNDIIDRRRDAQLAPTRPLPGGRIGVGTAHAICGALALLALAGGTYLATRVRAGEASLLVLLGTMALIGFYDGAGKYLVAPGLLTLGLIRFFHAAIVAPMLPTVWHPLLLLNHVTILSAVAYRWEAKRPALTAAHWAGVLGGLAVVDGSLLGLVAYRRSLSPVAAGLAAPPGSWHAWTAADWSRLLSVDAGLALPAALAAGFAVAAWLIRRGNPDRRSAGRRLVLVGLLWLILYDAAFALSYAGPRSAAAIAALLPLAYGSVRLMRAWSAVAELGQRPEYQRAR